MISRTAASGFVKTAAVLASVVAAAVGKGETAADVDVATNAKHTQITLILLTLIGISLRTNAFLGMATMMATEEATRVAKGAKCLDPPAVYLQQVQTVTMPLIRLMYRPTSWLCPKFQC